MKRYHPKAGKVISHPQTWAMGNRIDAPEFSERLRSGDSQAFDDLFCVTYPGLIRFATQLTRSHEMAEDIVMETFRKVWERRAVWRPDNPRVYLYGAVRNNVATSARNLSVQETLLGRVMDDKPGMSADLESPDTCVEEGEWFSAFTRALLALPERQQQVLTLRQEQGLKNAAVASMLGISVKTVEKDVTAAFKVLRATLAAFR